MARRGLSWLWDLQTRPGRGRSAVGQRVSPAWVKPTHEDAPRQVWAKPVWPGSGQARGSRTPTRTLLGITYLPPQYVAEVAIQVAFTQRSFNVPPGCHRPSGSVA